jgi:hypothetical protein
MIIDEIEMYFDVFGYPNEDIEILPGQFVLVENAEYFVQSSLLTLRTHPGNKRYMPYFERLNIYYKLANLIKKEL